jgi:hypothetical protein
MRVLLVLAGVLLLGYFVADRVRQLPGHVDAIASANAIIAKPVLAAVAPAEAVPGRAVGLIPAGTEAQQQRPHMHPVALVSLDAATARFPAKPADPIGQFALVLPAPIPESTDTTIDARWWSRDHGQDLTGDVIGLRLAWPHPDSAFASATDDLPSSPASVGAPTTEAAAAQPAEQAAHVAAVEAPVRSIEADAPGAAQRPAIPPTALLPNSTAPLPAARGETLPRPRPKGMGRAKQPVAPAPPRRLASAASDEARSVPNTVRPSLICTSSACGPRLLLLGVGF